MHAIANCHNITPMLYSIYLTLLFAERLAVALFDWGSWGKPDSIMACGCGVQNRPNTQVLPRHNFFSPFILSFPYMDEPSCLTKSRKPKPFLLKPTHQNLRHILPSCVPLLLLPPPHPLVSLLSVPVHRASVLSKKCVKQAWKLSLWTHGMKLAVSFRPTPM